MVSFSFVIVLGMEERQLTPQQRRRSETNRKEAEERRRVTFARHAAGAAAQCATTRENLVDGMSENELRRKPKERQSLSVVTLG